MPQSDSSLRRAAEHFGKCGTLGGWQRIRRRTPFFPRLVRGVRPRVSLFVRSHDLDPRAATGQTQSSTRVHAIAAPREGQGCQRIGPRISSKTKMPLEVTETGENCACSMALARPGSSFYGGLNLWNGLSESNRHLNLAKSVRKRKATDLACN